MLAVLAALGYAFFGLRAVIWAIIGAIPILLIGQRVSPQLMLRLYGARPVSPEGAPTLYKLVRSLSERADLPRLPQLYYIPSSAMNAFSVGTRQDAALGITDGMLRGLTQRELVGVLAHEIAHIRDNDMRVMGFADIISRITGFLARMGQLLLFFNLPMLLMGRPTISWFGVLLLIAAPTVTGLLQLGLSRTREFQADLTAARLTHDPEGLAGALRKLEVSQQSILGRILLPNYRRPGPSLFRTHPHTDERVERLLSLKEPEGPRIAEQVEGDAVLPEHPPRRHGPQWYPTGIWR
jgi:heat shock protein HtpX